MGRDQSGALLTDAERQRIIVEGDAALLVKKAQEIGKALKQADLKSAQIRNIFGTVRQIQATWPLYTGVGVDETAYQEAEWAAYRQLQLLKPKLAYQAARNRPVQGLADILTPAIDEVGADRGRFQHFVDFFEAILAYHVAAGGK